MVPQLFKTARQRYLKGFWREGRKRERFKNETLNSIPLLSLLPFAHRRPRLCVFSRLSLIYFQNNRKG